MMLMLMTQCLVLVVPRGAEQLEGRGRSEADQRLLLRDVNRIVTKERRTRTRTARTREQKKDQKNTEKQEQQEQQEENNSCNST
jgi:hypothetical protein